MPIIYPRIECSDARILINKIRRLTAKRKWLEISRHQFLREYSVLREALNQSGAYQQLRKKVFDRAEGVCEKCRSKRGNQMAHVTPVAMSPERALDEKNVYWACRECHQLDHPDLKLVK